MKKMIKLIITIYFSLLVSSLALSKENFFDEALKMYEQKEYDKAQFMFERNIVFNPKNAKS